MSEEPRDGEPRLGNLRLNHLPVSLQVSTPAKRVESVLDERAFVLWEMRVDTLSCNLVYLIEVKDFDNLTQNPIVINNCLRSNHTDVTQASLYCSGVKQCLVGQAPTVFERNLVEKKE